MRRSLSSLINPGIVGAALAIHPVATVEDFEILRRIGVAPVKVWLLGRWRLAQEFFSHPCSLSGSNMERIMTALIGFFIGGFLGWFMGVAWYEFIEVPNAASMDPLTVPSYLCAAGGALPLLAVPGAILGAILGAIVGKRQDGRGVRKDKNGRDQMI